MVWVWIWKISPKNIKFFNFFYLRSGQNVPGSKAGQPLIYCGSKVCSVRVRAHLYKRLFKRRSVLNRSQCGLPWTLFFYVSFFFAHLASRLYNICEMKRRRLCERQRPIYALELKNWGEQKLQGFETVHYKKMWRRFCSHHHVSNQFPWIWTWEFVVSPPIYILSLSINFVHLASHGMANTIPEKRNSCTVDPWMDCGNFYCSSIYWQKAVNFLLLFLSKMMQHIQYNYLIIWIHWSETATPLLYFQNRVR